MKVKTIPQSAMPLTHTPPVALSTLGTQILRRLISRPFAKKSIFEFEPQIRASLDQLSTVLATKAKQGSAFDLSKMSRCLSLDYISKFVYGECLESVNSPGFQDPILDAFDSFVVSNFLVP